MEPMANDILPSAIASGSVIVCGDIQEFTKNGVKFMDGTEAENIDVVVMATGYKIQFPFLDEKVVKVEDNKVCNSINQKK